jgi:hypothetical protein
MGSWKRLFYFLLLNVVVSALTTYLVVSIMLDRYPNATLAQPLTDPGSAAQVQGGIEGNGSGQEDDEGDGSITVTSIGQMEIDSIIGAGDVENERVLIRHVGDEEISLAGWQLQDEDGNRFTLPALTMFTGGAVTVYSRVGVNTVVELYWGMNKPVWEEGEQALLVDPNGGVQAVYTVP